MVTKTDFWIKKLEFKHFVVDRQGIIFASARDKDNKVINFIINPHTGTVLEQVNSHFESVNSEYADYIKRSAEHYYGITPIYRIPLFNFS